MDAFRNKLREFVRTTPVNQPVVLVSSGSAGTSADALVFGADQALLGGAVGARAAEEFLLYGYHVVFLHAQGSLLPFTSHLPAGPELLRGLHAHASGSNASLSLRCEDVSVQGQLAADVRAWEAATAQGSPSLLCVPYAGAEAYLQLLQTAATVLDGMLSLRSRFLLHLVAVCPKNTAGAKVKALKQTPADTVADTAVTPPQSPPPSPARSPGGRARRPSVVVTEGKAAVASAVATELLLEKSFDEDREEEGADDDDDDEEGGGEQVGGAAAEPVLDEQQQPHQEEDMAGVQLTVADRRFHVANLAQQWAPAAYQHSGPADGDGHASAELPAVDAVAAGYLRWVMQMQQYHIHGTMNQFRNQTLAGTSHSGYRGRQEQLDDTSRADALEGEGEKKQEEEGGGSGEQWVTALLLGTLLGFAASRLSVGRT